jgi:hypothetical protein
MSEQTCRLLIQCLHHDSKQLEESGLTVHMGRRAGGMISQPEGNRQFGTPTRVDENLVYVVGWV